MPKLRDLYDDYGQSPWLDNLRRDWIHSGELKRWVDQGIRGVTSNPTIFQRAMTSTDAYHEQLKALVSQGLDIEESYWQLVVSDITDAARVLSSVYENSNGHDGYVSVEVSPELADDTNGTITAARTLRTQITEPNVMIKVPATPEGIPAIETLTSEGVNVNVTLIFSLARYTQVMNAYIAGLEERSGNLSGVHSVASFFISRVDSEVDGRLEAAGVTDAALYGVAAVAQARLAYALFEQTFSGERWEALERRGANKQRPLWASTSTKNPKYADTLYVDSLIGPNSVNTLPDATIAAFIDHGNLTQTIDVEVDEAKRTFDRLAELSISLEDVANKLEVEGVDSFKESFTEVLAALETVSKALE